MTTTALFGENCFSDEKRIVSKGLNKYHTRQWYKLPLLHIISKNSPHWNQVEICTRLRHKEMGHASLSIVMSLIKDGSYSVNVLDLKIRVEISVGKRSSNQTKRKQPRHVIQVQGRQNIIIYSDICEPLTALAISGKEIFLDGLCCTAATCQNSVTRCPKRYAAAFHGFYGLAR